MNPTVRHFLGFFLQFGVGGLMLLAIADDSFLFIPVGSDLLLVILVARHHQQLVYCVLGAALGSTVGVFIWDSIWRKGGEEGLKRLVKPRLHDYLKRQMERHASLVLIVSCLAPPPFPFGAAIATFSALQYPRVRLLTTVFIARTVRFSLVGWAAIHFGSHIIRMARSSNFKWFMIGFIALCVIGSALEILRWVRMGHTHTAPEPS